MSEPLVYPASCVAIGTRAILIEGPSGAGKSALALALIDRGATLVSDDMVSLTAHNGDLIANPAPNISGKLEIRNLGIVDLPFGEAPVCLALELCENAPRFVEAATAREWLGISIPSLKLFPDTPHLALRAEWALTMFGGLVE